MGSLMAFTSLLDRGSSAEVELAAWCPSMDLLALVTVDGQLHVHRLNWQRLWCTAPEATVTAMAWHPDGKQLAVGLEDGQLLVLNTEDGDVIRKAQLFVGSAVGAVAWTEQRQAPATGDGSPAEPAPPPTPQHDEAGPLAGGSEEGEGPAFEDRARRLFRPLPLQPGTPVGATAAGAAAGNSYAGLRPPGATPAGRGGHWLPQPGRLALLAAASAGGELALCTGGLFPLATADLPHLLGAQQGMRVLRVAVAGNLRELAVCWQEGEGPPSSEPGQGVRLRLSRLDLGPLGPSVPLLHRLGLAAVDLTSLLSDCVAAWEAACGEWAGGMREVRESIARLGVLLRDYGGEGGAAEELARALSTGIIGGALQQYLTSTLGEVGVKKLARAVDAAVHAVHAALIDTLAPAAQLAAFRLGELRGLAAPGNAPALAQLGLQAAELEAAEAQALALLLRTERLRRQLVEVGADYRALFSWLLTMARRVQEDQPDSMLGFPRSQMDRLGGFLRNEFIHDSVGAAMKGCPANAPATPPASTAGGSPETASPSLALVMGVLHRYRGRSTSDGSTADSAGPVAAQRVGGGVAEQLVALSSACEVALGRTSQALSPGVTLAGSWRLGPAPSLLALEYRLVQQEEGPASEGSQAATAAASAECACVCASWTTGRAPAAEAAQRLLLLRVWGGGVAAGKEGRAQVEGALVQLPPGERAVDAGFYKEGRLLVGLASSGQGGGSGDTGGAEANGGPTCRVVLVGEEAAAEEVGGVRYSQLPGAAHQGADVLQALQGMPPLPLPAGCRQRTLPYPTLHAPLAISASRGVACLLVGTQRVMLLDLEEDEGARDDEEVEEDGAGHGAMDG